MTCKTDYNQKWIQEVSLFDSAKSDGVFITVHGQGAGYYSDANVA